MNDNVCECCGQKLPSVDKEKLEKAQQLLIQFSNLSVELDEDELKQRFYNGMKE